MIEEEIQEQTSKIQKALGDFKIEKADRIYVNKASDTLLNEQQNFMSSLNGIKTSISNLTTTLTEEQKNYYTVLLNSSEDSVEEKDVDIVVFKPINLKYIVLGLFIGGFLIIVCYGILYTVKGNLKVEKEIEEYYGIPFLGKVQSEKNALNGIDYFFDKIFNQAEKYSEEECLQLICTNILINIRKKHMKHIHITGIADSEYTDKIKRQVVEELQSEHLILECSVGKSIIHNINSLNDLANSDGVVFVEEIGKSNFEEIGKEINFCLNNNINVIGAIVID